MINRRQAIQHTALLTVAAASASVLRGATPAAPAPVPTGPFTLPALPYAFDALEPHIDAMTMQIHHDRHHQTYITNLNKAVSGNAQLEKKSAEELISNLDTVPEPIRKAVRNHGGGHVNHSLFWQMMKKGGGGKPGGELAAAIDKKFGSFDTFKEEFTKTATGLFGSGWAWLYHSPRNGLMLSASANQDNPLMEGVTPLLGLDVWEHAYYLKYQNKRADYITAFYNVINWDFVAARFAKAGR